MKKEAGAIDDATPLFLFGESFGGLEVSEEKKVFCGVLRTLAKSISCLIADMRVLNR